VYIHGTQSIANPQRFRKPKITFYVVKGDRRQSIQLIGDSLLVESMLRVAGEVTSTALSQASGVVQAVESSVRAALTAARRAQEMARAEAAVLRTQNQLTAHCWLHEDLLAAAQVAPPPSTLSESSRCDPTLRECS
jgi:hypothetical protein